MNLLDVKTVSFGYAVSNAISTMVICILLLQNRRRFAGLGCWLADFIMQFVALCLVILPGGDGRSRFRNCRAMAEIV